PDWQYPHCTTSSLCQAAFTASATVPDTPSMVVIFLPAASPTIMEQERAASPSICTVQAPHSARPQPYLVPVSPTKSRIAHNRGIFGSTLSSIVRPLMLSAT